jgi:hypothetical protein
MLIARAVVAQCKSDHRAVLGRRKRTAARRCEGDEVDGCNGNGRRRLVRVLQIVKKDVHEESDGREIALRRLKDSADHPSENRTKRRVVV